MSLIKFDSVSFIILRSPLQNLDSVYSPNLKGSKVFQEGLYLSSPEFWEELRKDKESIKKEKLEQTFLKYWIRSSTRCTPFGTFAGSTFIKVSDEDTALTLANPEHHLRSIRLDMNYITRLVNAICDNAIICEQIHFFPNNSIYVLPNSIRYAEYIIKNDIREYSLSSIEKTRYLMTIIERSNNGATINQLITEIINTENNISEEEARSYIIELWRSQILVSELEPCITGDSPLEVLIEQLSTFKQIDKLKTNLRKINYLLKTPKPGVEYYKKIEKEINGYNIITNASKNTLQVDLFLSTQSNTINKFLIDEIISQASDLLVLSRRYDNTDLNTFKTKFYAKYDEAEIPLNIALDAEIGIGYAGFNGDSAGHSFFIDDLPNIETPHKVNNSKIDYITQFTLSKYLNFLEKEPKPSQIEITEDELKKFKLHVDSYDFPDSMFLLGSLMKEKKQQLTKTNFLFDISMFAGPSAGNLLGRFTHGDKKLCEATRDILSQDEERYPDIIFAEIAHLPQARTGNILLRPILRKYEIPYVGKSGIPLEQQIPIEDLTVSIKNNEIILYSIRLKKRVIPRLTTAHNFTFGSLPIYKFLCDLQMQGFSYPCFWDWGSLDIQNFLPRVIYKNLILNKARWIFSEPDISDLPKNRKEYLPFFKSFCKKNNLPSRVVYKEGDNDLLIDFSKQPGILLFLHYLKKFKKIKVEEFLFNTENCIVHDNTKASYTNEVIIPIRQKRNNPSKALLPFKSVSKKISRPLKRKFYPNSEWLYFKVYCGTRNAELLLKEILLPFLEQGIQEKLFEYFFFIRYKDDRSHLRIRFYNSNLDGQIILQKKFITVIEPYINNGLVENISINSYVREIERYQETLIENTEKLFFNDSLSVLRLINLLETEGDSEKYRLLLALRGIDMLLNDFGLELHEKHKILQEISTHFFKEFGELPILKQSLNKKYKNYQQMIFSHLDSSQDNFNNILEAIDILRVRSFMNKPIIESMILTLGDDSSQELPTLIPNYLHMFVNRLFIAKQRKYELLIYHLLERYYNSLISINKKHT